MQLGFKMLNQLKRMSGLAMGFALYGAASLALFYHHGLITGSEYFGSDNDPFLYIWIFKFLPKAVIHFQNPLILPEAWAPYGLNITQATTTPLLAIIAWPLTAMAGPVISFNIVSMSAPALAAISAFLLIREITGRWLASFVGGWIFGFSTVIFVEMIGHLQSDFVMFIPLTFLALVLRLKGKISFGGCVGLLAVFGVFQFLTSLENYVFLVIFTVIFVVSADYVRVGTISHLLRISRDGILTALGVSFVITALLVSPFIYYFFRDYSNIPHVLQDGSYYATDLLNLVIPTPTTLIGGNSFLSIAAKFRGREGYIGLPLAAIGIWTVWKIRRAALAKPIFITFAAALVFSLGPILHVDGIYTIPLPWFVMAKLPFLANALPSRMMVFVMLFLGLSCAIWLSTMQKAYLTTCIIVLFASGLMLPASRLSARAKAWNSAIPTSPLFKGGTYRQYIGAGQNVLFLPLNPTNGEAVFWQTETSGYFRTINGYGNFVPSAIENWPTAKLMDASTDLSSIDSVFKAPFNAFMKANNVRYVFVPPDYQTSWAGFLGTAGWSSDKIGAGDLYHISKVAWDAIPDQNYASSQQDFDQVHLGILQQAVACMLNSGASAISLRSAVAAKCLDQNFNVRPITSKYNFGRVHLSTFGLMGSCVFADIGRGRWPDVKYWKDCLNQAFAASADPSDNWDRWNGWIAKVGNQISVSILASGAEANNIIPGSTYPAVKIYFPYPQIYNPHFVNAATKGQLLFVYRVSAF